MAQLAKNSRYTALYERLSRDDEQLGESNSITNQAKYLEDYARQHGFRNIRHFKDDGYTGTNFNRPGFNDLLAEVEAGNVDTVIVKDMSRFGRNYLQVGFYTEILFPNKGVRFIAINNSVDSANPTDNDFTPFLNIMNEWYAKDTSNKIKAIFKSRMQDGKRCSGAIPFGYTRKPDDKQTLYVDEEAAKTVRRVFDLACEGKGPAQIADILEQEKVLIPAAHARKYHPEDCRAATITDPYHWTATGVTYILDRQEYLGHTVLGKTIRDNFKSKKRRKARPEELMFFPDTHEAIITQEIWDKAQRLRKRATKRTATGTYSHPMAGLLYCADCGSKLGLRTEGKKEEGKEPKYSFQCSNYRSNGGYGECESHYISAANLEPIVLNAIQVVSQYAIENEEEFASQLMEQWEAQQSSTLSEDKKALAVAKNRIDELDVLIRNLYESNVAGKVTDRQCRRLMEQYDGEQEALEKQIEELEGSISASSPQKPEISRFLNLIRRYGTIEELTDTLLYDFVDRIIVHAPVGGRSAYRYQRVDVIFNFIGGYFPPFAQVTEEEHTAAVDKQIEEKKKKENAQRRENYKRRVAEMTVRAEEGDEEAIAWLAHNREVKRANSARGNAKHRERRNADPEYIARQEAKEQEKIRKVQEQERKRQERACRKKKESRAELKQRAATGDPEAIAAYEALLAHETEVRAVRKEKEQKRMAEDPEYAEYVRQMNLERSRRHSARRSEKLQELKDRAEAGDEAAIRELAEIRAKGCEAATRSRKKMLDEAEAGDPEAIARKENYSRLRSKNYYRKKEAMEADPAMQPVLEARKARADELYHQRYDKHRERMESDPEYAEAFRARANENTRRMKERRKAEAEKEAIAI